MSASVVRGGRATSFPAPRVSIVIAVDTAYVAARAGDGMITKGVFLMDNRVRSGSSGEGTIGLRTVCDVTDLIGILAIPISAAGSPSDSVVITGFADVQGEVFTGAGHPVPASAPDAGPPGSYWIGQAMRGGTETYQIEIEVTVGQLQPMRFYVWWEPKLTAS